jgi:hypothetical protein
VIFDRCGGGNGFCNSVLIAGVGQRVHADKAVSSGSYDKVICNFVTSTFYSNFKLVIEAKEGTHSFR